MPAAKNTAEEDLFDRLDPVGIRPHHSYLAFGRRLRECRGLCKTVDVAPKIGKTQQTWNGWERGRTQPDFATLVKICQLFDVSSDYLLGLSQDKKPATLSAVTKGANSPALATSGGSAYVGGDSALAAHLAKQVDDLTAEKNRLLGIIERLSGAKGD